MNIFATWSQARGECLYCFSEAWSFSSTGHPPPFSCLPMPSRTTLYNCWAELEIVLWNCNAFLWKSANTHSKTCFEDSFCISDSKSTTSHFNPKSGRRNIDTTFDQRFRLSPKRLRTKMHSLFEHIASFSTTSVRTNMHIRCDQCSYWSLIFEACWAELEIVTRNHFRLVGAACHIEHHMFTPTEDHMFTSTHLRLHVCVF